jgi:hypothetical protein
MPRKVFEGFTPLDAEDVNTYLMDQAVMSFAGTAARGSALPSPSDGMVSWLQDSDSLTIFNGSAWESAAVQPTLVFISKDTFSAVASDSVNSVFSSAYTNYIVLLNLTSASDQDANITLRVRASGSDLTTNTYEVGEYFVGVARTIAAGSTNSSLTSSMRLGQTQAAAGYSGEVKFCNPFTATNTVIFQNGAGGSLGTTAGVVVNTVSYDGFTISVASGTITGTISVYGIKES